MIIDQRPSRPPSHESPTTDRRGSHADPSLRRPHLRCMRPFFGDPTRHAQPRALERDPNAVMSRCRLRGQPMVAPAGPASRASRRGDRFSARIAAAECRRIPSGRPESGPGAAEARTGLREPAGRRNKETAHERVEGRSSTSASERLYRTRKNPRYRRPPGVCGLSGRVSTHAPDHRYDGLHSDRSSPSFTESTGPPISTVAAGSRVGPACCAACCRHRSRHPGACRMTRRLKRRDHARLTRAAAPNINSVRRSRTPRRRAA